MGRIDGFINDSLEYITNTRSREDANQTKRKEEKP